MTEMECRLLNVGDRVALSGGAGGVVVAKERLPLFYRSGRRRFASRVEIAWDSGRSVSVDSDDLPIGWERVRVV